jgi:hypothetical protein
MLEAIRASQIYAGFVARGFDITPREVISDALCEIGYVTAYKTADYILSALDTAGFKIEKK